MTPEPWGRGALPRRPLPHLEKGIILTPSQKLLELSGEQQDSPAGSRADPAAAQTPREDRGLQRPLLGRATECKTLGVKRGEK